jgi:exosortase
MKRAILLPPWRDRVIIGQAGFPVNPGEEGYPLIRDRSARFAYAFILILFATLAYPTVVWLVRSWLANPYYSHGFLVPPIAALFAWRQWKYLLREPRAGNTWAGLPITAVGLATVLWAMRWHNYFVAGLSLIVLWIGILLYLEGWPRLRYWLFPLLFLALMVPLPVVDRASPWFEAFTARSAVSLARALGIPAVQQGGEILLPNAAVVVGAPCSGLRSLVAMLTVGVGWVYLVEGRWLAKALLLAAIVPFVAASNVLRITLLLGVALLFGQDTALTFYHDWSSPVLFLLALGALLLLGKALGCSRVRTDIF